MEPMREIDQEITEILRLTQGAANRLRRGRGRSLRPGRNHLRRMSTGRLVREHRRQVNAHQRGDVSDDATSRGLLAIGAEFGRRGLTGSAAAIEHNEQADEAQTPGGQQAKQVIDEAQKHPGATEDAEGARLEETVDKRVNELGGDEQPIVTERETSALSNDELVEDLEDAEIDPETYDAVVFSGEVNGDDPQEGLEFAQQTHPETLEFEAIDLAQVEDEDEASL